MFIYNRFRFKWVWIASTIWLSLVIIFNSRLYFNHGLTPVFLLEKGSLVDNALWYTSFRFHVVSSCACLLTGAAIMLDSKLRFRQLHTILGNLYVCLVLWIAVPTGLIMAPFAKGGALSATGFFVTGLYMWWATWQGYQAIRAGKIVAHVRWMLRSFALVLSAIFFRIIQIVLVFVETPTLTAYIASVWLSLIASILVAEFCIQRQFPKHHPNHFLLFNNPKEFQV